jgi:serine protease Do
LAVGNPFGLGGSVTRGILSSKNRRPSTGDEPLNVEDWLQTDAAINPGNSGGPLVNLRGELIGLNVAVYRAELGEGLGFSIPVKEVSAALAQFFTPELSHGLWFGAQFRSTDGRILVSQVQSGSPAEKGRLREGDELVTVNGVAPGKLIDCGRRLGDSPSHKAELVVKRGTERLNLRVQLVPFEQLIKNRIGLTLVEPGGRLGVGPGQGLYVDGVEQGSPADQVGLRQGYILSALDGQTAGDLRSIGQILSNRKPGDTVTLTLVVPRRLGGSYLEVRQGTVEVRLR